MTAQPFIRQQRQEDPIIPVQDAGVTLLCLQTFLAVIAGLALRLLFVFRFPSTAGDSDTYLELARNWANHHLYGLWLGGHLVPTDLRMPGYPAFLAGVSMLLGRSMTAISLSQALLDLATCFLTAVMAAALAPASARRRVWTAGLWLAATCPFVANYSSVVLTEVLVTFFTTGALACFVLSLRQPPADFKLWLRPGGLTPFAYALLGAFLTGLATLVRPEMPLLLATAALVFAFRWWRALGFRRMVMIGVAMAGIFLAPIAPWATRNFLTLHEAQILAPRYATMPGEYAPVGYYAWTQTWLERYRDTFYSVWAIGEDPMNIGDSPSTAFDSLEEKARVAALFAQYNRDPGMEISPELDKEFAELARERTSRHPLRTYLQVPFQRALTMWFTPRTELLPIDGKLWPLRDQWQDSHADVLTTAGFAVLGYLYVALALAGIGFAWRAGRATGKLNLQGQPNFWGIGLLAAYLFVRTVFLTTVEAPEPRYVVSCYPAVLALIALLFAGKRSSQQE
jgi:hypothetical protein